MKTRSRAEGTEREITFQVVWRGADSRRRNRAVSRRYAFAKRVSAPERSSDRSGTAHTSKRHCGLQLRSAFQEGKQHRPRRTDYSRQPRTEATAPQVHSNNPGNSAIKSCRELRSLSLRVQHTGEGALEGLFPFLKLAIWANIENPVTLQCPAVTDVSIAFRGTGLEKNSAARQLPETQAIIAENLGAFRQSAN